MTNVRPKVLIVGGPDVHQRLDLMRELRDDFEFDAAGTAAELRPVFEAEGFPYHHYRLGRGVDVPGALGALGSLRTLCARLRPDIVHAFATKPSVWGRLAAHAAGVPVVIGTLPGLGSLYTGSGIRKGMVRIFYERLQRAASRRAALTMFQNHQDEAEMVASGIVPAARTAVIPGSGVRTGYFDPTLVAPERIAALRRELALEPDAVVVTMISRVIRSKGALDFARIADDLAEGLPDVRFLLVGPNDGGSLDALAPAELGWLSDRVTWPGARSDIREILAASDIFVLPTRYREGVPRVLLEAASMGLPLVATRSAGCTEVVDHGRNGFLAAPGDLEALGAFIVALATDPGLRDRLGRISRVRATAEFDIRVTARLTARWYHDLLAAGHRPGAEMSPAEPLCSIDTTSAAQPQRAAAAMD